MALATPLAAQVALYLDTHLSRELMAHVVERCRDMGANLLCLAPPPLNLAVSRLEPHLGVLDRAGITWELQEIGSDLTEALRNTPKITLLVCAGRSALAQHRERLAVPLLILLNPEHTAAHRKPDLDQPVDWLSPRFHRGF